MSNATDQMLARYVGEIEERQQFINGLVESAAGEDLTDEKMELVTRAKDRVAEAKATEQAGQIGQPSAAG